MDRRCEKVFPLRGDKNGPREAVQFPQYPKICTLKTTIPLLEMLFHPSGLSKVRTSDILCVLVRRRRNRLSYTTNEDIIWYDFAKRLKLLCKLSMLISYHLVFVVPKAHIHKNMCTRTYNTAYNCENKKQHSCYNNVIIQYNTI